MKTMGIQVVKKLHVLLAVLLCGVFAFAMPVTVKAAPTQHAAQQSVVDLAAAQQIVLFAGDVTSGAPEAVLQLDRSLLTPILQVLLQQLYPLTSSTAPAAHSYPASKGDCGLHSILTKGP
ncbi:hypothetical protein ACSX1A_06150 [Pontibacter sp. MBLB2868]|uniref:hypothetical protein n=1 Tax=Pontibacter sp. MBLB2868 TaxID=3451555 RepID=UPI003F75587A